MVAKYTVGQKVFLEKSLKISVESILALVATTAQFENAVAVNPRFSLTTFIVLEKS